MLQKISVRDAEKISRKFPVFSYRCNPYYLAYNGYTEQDSELLIYERDPLYKNEFPLIALPKNKEHWQRMIIDYVSEEELEEIKKTVSIKDSFPVGSEYYYSTADFVSLDNPHLKSFKKHCKKFESSYTYTLKNSYPTKKILAFLEKWEKSKKNRNELFSMAKEYERFCILKCSSMKGKWLFLEINGELAGYNLSYQIDKNFWIGIHQKVLYEYKGISRFLLHKRAAQFPKTTFFSLGQEARDEGIAEFKEGLHPFKKINRYYVITAETTHSP